MKRLKHVVDIAFALVLLYVSYWVYELSNFIAYSLAGLSPTISIAGFFPAGISAVVGQGTLLVKIFQVLIACTVPITILSIFIASFYWEFLSSAKDAPLDLHTIAFAAVAAISQYTIVKVTKASHLFNETHVAETHVPQ